MFQDGAHLLRKCIEAEYRYRLLVEEYQAERERVFAGHYPGYETKYGRIEQETISTENAVIYIVEAEERFKAEIKPLKANRTMLKQALNILTKEELEVFNHVVWGEQLECEVDRENLNYMSDKINQKLCRYLSDGVYEQMA